MSTYIDKKEVLETFVRSSGPGGQHVNKASTCVQLLHIPTGIVVKCQESRHQDLNRERAWEILTDKLEQRERAIQMSKQAAAAKKRRQNRRPSQSAKERMIKTKKRRSSVKSNRKKVNNDD